MVDREGVDRLMEQANLDQYGEGRISAEREGRSADGNGRSADGEDRLVDGCGLVDEEGRLVDREGRSVDREGRPTDEEVSGWSADDVSEGIDG